MADEFTTNQIQGVFGLFSPVIDETLVRTENNIQGIFGEFKPILDESATNPPASSVPLTLPVRDISLVLPERDISLSVSLDRNIDFIPKGP